MTRDIKRLYRSASDSRLAGVCGGVGLYFGIDPVIVRLLWIGVTCLTGFIPGTMAYLAAWLIVPLEPLPAPVASPATTEVREGSA